MYILKENFVILIHDVELYTYIGMVGYVFIVINIQNKIFSGWSLLDAHQAHCKSASNRLNNIHLSLDWDCLKAIQNTSRGKIVRGRNQNVAIQARHHMYFL